jgi:hypothetical protein
METQEQIGTGISYDHLSSDDKHYFGGFLNLAQNNIDGVIQEMCQRLNLTYEKEQQNNILFNRIFKDNISETDWERAINIMKEYWPIVYHLDVQESNKRFETLLPQSRKEAKRKYFKSNLKLLLSAVNDLRNYYTHYFHNPITLPSGLFSFLDSVLFDTVITVKKNKMKDDKTRQLLKAGIQEELAKLIALKKKELTEKKKLNARINLNDEKGMLNSVYNDAFSHLLFTAKVSKKEELANRYKSRLQDNMIDTYGIEISTAGLLFLLSMFLSKKETEQLKANIEGYKGKVMNAETAIDKDHNSLRYMATHWVFSNLSFKGLKQRLTNTFDKESLLIQMMDELNKVPDEVYQTLSEDNKKEFLEDINEYVSESADNDENPLYVVHPVIRKRYEDKFSYFAIRFLDEFADFPTLRFQIFAGHYLHDSRPKQIGSANVESQRNIKEKINVFGRLSETVKLKNDYFETHASEEGWELFPNPSYNWVANNIPVYIDLLHKNDRAKEIQIHINQLHTKLNPPKKRIKRIEKNDIISQVYNKQVAAGDPTLLLSNNELMSMLYELLVKKKTGAEIENRIVDKIIERYDLIMHYQPDDATPSTSSMPKKLQQSSSGNERIDLDKLLRAIERETDNGKAKKALIEKHQQELRDGILFARNNKFKSQKGQRKHLFYTSEMGQEATWIVNDLKRFMPLAVRAQWKGYHHSELQRLIAFYDTHRLEAKQLIESVWPLQDKAIWRTEFGNAFQKLNFVDFYRAYLRVRETILNGFAASIQHNLNDAKIIKKILPEVFLVFDKRFYQLNSTERQKEELLAKPFAFPRGLFDEKPTVVPGFKPQENPEKFADWYVYGYRYSGKYQSFYAMAREYATLYNTRKKNGQLPALAGKDEAHKQMRFRMSCDLQIKKIQFQDLYVKLMVDKLFEDTFNQQPEFDLGRLYDTQEERRINESNALGQKDKQTGDYSENIRNENYIWNKTFSVTLSNGQITEENVKLKDVGKFRRFVNDAKVVALLSYDTTKTWSKIELEDELENRAFSYEAIRRTTLLRQIHQFEKYILESNEFDGKQHPNALLWNGNPNFRMYVGNGILKKQAALPPEELSLITDNRFEDIGPDAIKQCEKVIQEAYILILLRNKFGHNQLPDKEHYNLIRSLFPDLQQNSYSDYFNNVTGRIIANLKSLNQ